MSYLVKIFGVAVLVASANATICKTSTSENCYWTEYLQSQVTVVEANRICTSQGAYLGVIYDEQTYNEIIEDARREMGEHNVGGFRGFWTGANYDPVNNKMYPDGAFNGNWRPSYPKSNPDSTVILLSVRLDSEASDQGLMNMDPVERRIGVVCRKPRAGICKTSTSKNCYWTEYLESQVNVVEANSFCTSQGAYLGVIYDEQTYDEIVEDARREMGENNVGGNRGFWTGANYDPVNNKMYPDGAFNGNWRPSYPKLNPDSTGILLAVRIDSESTDQGLMNLDPVERRIGVVCREPTTDTCNEEEEDYLSDPTNRCSGTFYQCANDVWVEQHCAEELKFNVEISECDYDYNVGACN